MRCVFLVNRMDSLQFTSACRITAPWTHRILNSGPNPPNGFVWQDNDAMYKLSVHLTVGFTCPLSRRRLLSVFVAVLLVASTVQAGGHHRRDRHHRDGNDRLTDDQLDQL